MCSSLSHVRFFVTLLSLSFPLHILTKRGSGKNVLNILTEILVKHPVMSHNGKEYEKEYTHTHTHTLMCVYITESLCYTAEINTTL